MSSNGMGRVSVEVEIYIAPKKWVILENWGRTWAFLRWEQRWYERQWHKKDQASGKITWGTQWEMSSKGTRLVSEEQLRFDFRGLQRLARQEKFLEEDTNRVKWLGR